MEIFKLFESAMANIQPGHMNIKDLRRDQLLDHYDDATKALQTLVRAKESEITFRKDLIGMLEQSKVAFDNKLTQAKQNYQIARKQAPETLDLKSGTRKLDGNINIDPTRSTTPPMPPPTATQINAPPPMASFSNNSPMKTAPLTSAPSIQVSPSASQQSSNKNSDLDIPLPTDSHENRTSLDRRLSEFLKTFPNLTQAGLTPPTNNEITKPLPGYYTQQPPPPPPISTAPNLMAMMRFPPPNMMPIHQQQIKKNHPMSNHENHDTADMEVSDCEESANNAGPVIPMIASALQRGAGGKQNADTAAFVAGQQFSNPIQYAPRLSALPFDPAIMDPGLRDSSSNSSRDRHSPSGHRHGSSSRGSGSDSKHSSTKNRYSSSSSTSSHSSSRSKRR